jgi:predicted enzyme related to lactoylglutathione lyase
MAKRIRSIVFDCERPTTLARFWAEVLGYTVRPFDDEWLAELKAEGIEPDDAPGVVIDPPDKTFPTIWFNSVPESKATKNRVHLDVNLTSAEELDHLLALGAHVLRPFGAVEGESWAIMADPEGNEFCAFPPGD